VAGEAPSPSKGSRTRIYSVTLVVVTATVVTLAIILPVILKEGSMPPSPPVAGSNIQLDTYDSGPNWTGQFGDDPTVATAPNGTIAVAWEGFDELAPPSTPAGPPTYTTAIFVSFSSDGGQHYSAPLYVGSPGTVSAGLPSLAFAADGTLFIAYDNATNTDNQQILVASETDGRNFTPGIVAEQGQDLGRPWLSAYPGGALGLAFEYNTFVEWALSTNAGETFGPPAIVLQGFLTGATEWGNGEVTLVGLSAGAYTFTTISMWSVTIGGNGTGTPEIGAAATTVLPYPTSADLPNLSRPGPTVAAVGNLLYLFFANDSETELTLEVSYTNGSTWAGPFKLWTPNGLVIETPVAEASPDGSEVALGWESTQGGFWKAYSAMYDVRTGLLSAPAPVSNMNGFPATVRNWHGTSMGLASTDSSHFVVVWGDGRGLSGTYGLTHVYACTMTT
jgi:hypothetical protein